MPRKEDLVSVSLARRLSLPGATLLGVGVLIGGGLFTLLGHTAGLAGWLLPLVMVLNALIAFATAMAYTELGTARSEAGGGYIWIREGLGRTQGFFAGWISWGAHSVACALYALSFGFYASELLSNIFLPLFGIHSNLGENPDFHRWVAAGTIIFFGAVNIYGVGKMGFAGAVITLLQLVILGVFVGAGIYTIVLNPEGLNNFGGPLPHGMIGVLSGMALMYIAFQGSEIVVQSSEELKNPEKNLPKAILFSFAIVVTIYIIVAIVAIGGIRAAVPSSQILGDAQEGAMIEAARHFLLPGGVVLLTIGGALAGLAALNGTIFSSSHVSYAMGVSRQLPGFFAATNKKYRTQHWAILASVILILVLVIRFPLKDVASIADILFIGLFAQVHWALIRYRKEQPDLPRPFRVPFYPWTSYAVIFAYVILLPFFFRVSPIGIGIVAVWLVLGSLVHFLFTRRQEQEVIAQQEVIRETVFENIDTSVRGYRIILALGDTEKNEEVWKPYAELAYAFSKRHQPAEIHILRVHTVPPARSLRSLKQSELVYDEAHVRQVAQYLVDIKKNTWQGRIKDDVIRARSETEGILDVIDEYDADLLVVGWRGFAHSRGKIFGEHLDQLLYRVHCDVAFIKLTDLARLKRVLLASSGGAHARFAASIAAAIASHYAGNVTLMRVLPPGLSHHEQARLLAKTRNDLHWGHSDPLKERVTISRSPVETILEEARGSISSPGYDIIVMAASRGLLFKEMLVGNTAEKVALLSGKTVIIVKHHADMRKPVVQFIRERLPIKLFAHNKESG